MDWFYLSHVLLVILTVIQASIGQNSVEELLEGTTPEPLTTNSFYEWQQPPESANDENPEMARRFKKPPVSAYQPTRSKKPNNVVQTPGASAVAAAQAYAVPPIPYYPQPQQNLPPPLPRRPPAFRPGNVRKPHLRPRPVRRPIPRPVRPQSPTSPLGDFLPTGLSGLTNWLGGTNEGGSPLGKLANLVGPISGLVKPALSLLGPFSKSLLNMLPFGKNIMRIIDMIRNAINFFSGLVGNFSLSKLIRYLFGFIPNTIKRIFGFFTGLFSWIPRLISRCLRRISNLTSLIPKMLMLIPRFFHWLNTLPRHVERLISFFYRFCRSLEMLLAFFKQTVWNVMRLLGNTVLMPLRIVSKTIGKLIFLPIKLLSEPVLAFGELLRAIFYPFRKLSHYLLYQIKTILNEICYYLNPILNLPNRDYLTPPSQPSIIRVYPKLPDGPSPLDTSALSYILSPR